MNTTSEEMKNDIVDLARGIFALHAPPDMVYHIPRRKRYGPTVDVRTTPKVKRNEVCPCGSGIKHKKCCLK